VQKKVLYETLDQAFASLSWFCCWWILHCEQPSLNINFSAYAYKINCWDVCRYAVKNLKESAEKIEKQADCKHHLNISLSFLLTMVLLVLMSLVQLSIFLPSYTNTMLTYYRGEKPFQFKLC
jgi:hypothetical protein